MRQHKVRVFLTSLMRYLKGEAMKKTIMFLFSVLWIIFFVVPADAADPSYELDWAIMKGELETVKTILNEHQELADKPFKTQSNWRPLQWAVMNKRVEIVEYLLEFGVGVDARNNDGETALSILSTDLDANIGIAKVLIRYGANVNSKDNDGLTPLQNATQIGNTELAELLRAHGAKE